MSVVLVCIQIIHTMREFSFQSYHDGHLYMSLVAFNMQGEMLLGKGDSIVSLQDTALDWMIFTVRIRVPCDQLDSPVTVYWLVKGEDPQSANVPPQHCVPRATSLMQP